MIINHNLNAMNANRQMGINNTSQGKSIEKLSSGLRINRAGDDAAGLSISEKMRGQIRGLQQSSRNAQDGISLIQTAEGALNETHSILQRMRELSVQSTNGTNIDEDRALIHKEFEQLSKEVDRISKDTQFNKQSLLAGTKKVSFQVGANADQTIDINMADMSTKGLSISGAEISTQNGAKAAISSIDKAITAVSEQRSIFGSVQNRLESAINSTDNTAENLQAAESRIRDVDMAKEMMNFSKNNILAQAAQSMLAQANSAPQGVLSLLQ
ncbi:flagellin [Clostridium bornimense]|uniref:flagellin N-terminal helical domain-containing protein n=1 Tax=Clostridium bornimense TaxID=1216932 RepID=UPI001C1102DE|nr:flagellin [Clostridium bornimense]MBU5314799.1 flagellin [Clostridium bornimense]